MNPFDFLLVVLAAYRLTRFFVVDTFPLVRRPREWLERELPEGHWLSEITMCAFCMSGWVTPLVVGGWVWGGSGGRWVVTVLAAWGAVALAFAALDKD